MSNLASSYYDAGRRDEAIKLMEEVLALRRKVLGPAHPDTSHSLQILVGLYKTERRYADAEPLYRERLQSLTKRYAATNETVVSATAVRPVCSTIGPGANVRGRTVPGRPARPRSRAASRVC